MSLSASIFLGLVGGLLLSTRGIVLLIYILVLGYLFRKKVVTQGLFYLSVLAGFLVSLLPFVIWDWKQFMSLGPFSKQLSFLPVWLLALSIIVCAYLALKIGSLRGVYFAVSLTLFTVVLAAFLGSILDHGWHQSVLKDGFDISYFAFAVPFLLISLNFRKREILPSKRMFAAGSNCAPAVQEENPALGP